MCKVNMLHVACKAGSEDGRNFALTNDVELIAEIFSRQFFEPDVRDAYKANFLAEMGNRLSPVNGVPMRRFAFA